MIPLSGRFVNRILRETAGNFIKFSYFPRFAVIGRFSLRRVYFPPHAEILSAVAEHRKGGVSMKERNQNREQNQNTNQNNNQEQNTNQR